jgi:cellulose synthase operon protein C
MTTPAAGTRVVPTALPWSEREPAFQIASPLAASPRSSKDLALLRALSRRINTQDAGAQNNLGVVFYNKGLYGEAAERFEQALELDPRMQVAERNLQIAYFATGFFEDLLRELRQRLERDPEDVAARDRLARTYYYGGDATAALREWRRLLHLRPRDARLLQEIGRAEVKRGDLDAALAALRQAAQLDPDDGRIHLQIGEVLYQRGLYLDAREPLERAIGADDTMAEAHHLLAFVYGDMGDGERAHAAAARASELNPSYTKMERGLSLDRYSAARYQELVGERSQPGVAEGGALAHYNMGLAFRQKALYDEAMREFRLATERGEDSFLVTQAQAEMMLLRGEGAEAAGQYARLLEQEAASPKLWNEQGVARHQTGDLAGAEEGYRRALEIDPAYALAWNNLGIVRHHLGDGVGAERAFRSALREGRALADIWRNLGLMLQRTDRTDEAMRAYRSALDADPRAALAWTGLGLLLLESGQSQEAKNALLRAVEADPNLAEARYHLAFALSACGDYPGALRETRQALELNPYIAPPRFRLLIDLQFEEAGVLAPELDVGAQVTADEGIESFEFEPDALDAILGPAPQPETAKADAPSSPASIEWLAAARAALLDGRFDRAAADAQRAAAQGANRIEVLLVQAQIFLQRGLPGEAVERFDEALEELDRGGRGDDPSPHAALRRALHGLTRSLLDLRRLDAAVVAAERLTAQARDDVGAQTLLAEALQRAGDVERAIAVLEAAAQRAPDDVALLTQLGGAYRERGDHVRAEATLRRVLAASEQAPAARAALGRLLAAEDRTDEALLEFRAALDEIPSYADAAFGLADVEVMRGNIREAINVIVDFLTADPYSFQGLVRLGDLLFAGGYEEQAGVAYRRVLHFDPGHEAALEGLERLMPSEIVAAGD